MSEETTKDFQIGDRVLSKGSDKQSRGTVKYLGDVIGTKGSWIGVDWDDPSRGKHDGSHEGSRYFDTSTPTSGSFVRPHKVDRGQSIAQGIRLRYGEVEGDTAGVDKEELAELRKEMNAPFLEVVGFDKVNQRQSDFRNLRIVSLTNSGIHGYLEATDDLSELIPAVQEIDLSENLFKTWSEIVAIAQKLKKLRVLDVSSNKLELTETPEAMKTALGSLKQLIINDMNYSWTEVSILISSLPALEVLHVNGNKITEIDTLKEENLTHLKELDLSENDLGSWDTVMKLKSLPNLAILNLNNCKIPSVEMDSSQKPLFPSLKMLQLSHNLLNSWQDLACLIHINLTDMRIRANPILTTENGGTCRQLIIASIPSLKVLNGTEIFKTERYGAELDYLKYFGKEYLQLIKAQSELDEFYAKYPRYPELLKRFGPPEEHELVTVMDLSIKSNLLPVDVDCPSMDNFKKLSKKLPLNMTIHKVKTLLQRAIKAKGSELRLSYVSKDNPDVEVDMDNDLRELSFYSISAGDTIIVKLY